MRISAIVCDQNKRPIPYTNVVSTQKRNGTATDEKGQFTLMDISITDTLKISAIGYQPLFIPTQQFKNHDTLFLKEDIKVLDEVMIKDTDRTVYNREAKLGFFTLSKHNTFQLDQGTEVGVFIENPAERKALIKSVYFGIDNEGVKGSVLRIRFLGVTDAGEPSADLLMENVIINSQNLRHKNNIDISKYKILMPSAGMFVIIECVTASPDIANKNKVAINKEKVSLTLSTNNYKNLMWLNFRDKEWGHYHIPPLESGLYRTPDVGIEVAYPGNYQ